MIDERERLSCSIDMYRHYEKLRNEVWDIYADISQAYYMFEYYNDMMETYRIAIEVLLEN